MSEMKKGVCKWFNVAKGWGFIRPHAEQDKEIFVHQSKLQMKGFRSLAEGEEVEYKTELAENGLEEATVVTGPNGQDCVGSQTKPTGSRIRKKIRCYNCGMNDHIAKFCKEERIDKKVCYICKDESHLAKDCPDKT